MSGLVSGIRFSCSLRGTYNERSSTHFFLAAGKGFLVLLVWVIIFPISSFGAFGPAPLKVIQKQNNPNKVPWPHPEFNGALLDCFPKKRTINWRFER